jgi:hypothetical protein
MPAIRDVSQGYHGTTTYKHVEAPMPAYAQGDLLLAFVSIDDSAGLSAQDIIVGRRAKYVYMNAVDYTAQAADSGPADWYMTLLDPALSDCVYFGLGEKFNQINVLNSTQGVATSNPVWTPEYSKGSSVWATLACTDGIGPNFKFVTTVHAQTTFTPPVDWAKDTVNGVLAYWIRWRCTTDGVYTTRPISTQAWVFPVLNGNNGWRQLFKYYAGTTPAPMSAVWKIAGATEYDSTFFYVTAETADVELIAIRDVQGSVDSGVAAMTVNCNATERTYIRATGSWVTDGFAVGIISKIIAAITTSIVSIGKVTSRFRIFLVTSVSVAIITRVALFFRTLSVVELSIATLSRIGNRFRVLAVSAISTVSISRLVDYFRLFSIQTVSIATVNKGFFRTISVVARSIAGFFRRLVVPLEIIRLNSYITERTIQRSFITRIITMVSKIQIEEVDSGVL